MSFSSVASLKPRANFHQLTAFFSNHSIVWNKEQITNVTSNRDDCPFWPPKLRAFWIGHYSGGVPRHSLQIYIEVWFLWSRYRIFPQFQPMPLLRLFIGVNKEATTTKALLKTREKPKRDENGVLCCDSEFIKGHHTVQFMACGLWFSFLEKTLGRFFKFAQSFNHIFSLLNELMILWFSYYPEKL